MLPGILLSLSYDRCPVDPTIYLTDNEAGHLSIAWDNLGDLIDHLAEEMDKEFKPLTFGSAKQYLSAMRKGYRANRNGELPPLDVSLSEEEMMVYIPKRDYYADRAKYPRSFSDGSLHWIFASDD